MNSATLGKMMAVMAVAAMTFVASAESEVVDGVTWYYSIRTVSQPGGGSRRTASIQPVPNGGTAYAGDLIVPTTLGGCIVDTIAVLAFANSADLKSLVVPDQVAYVQDRAFMNCVNLVSVKLPSGMTGLTLLAFMGCSSLKEIVVPEGVRTMGGTFSGGGLKRIVLPSTLTDVQTGTHVPGNVEIDINGPYSSGMPGLIATSCWRCRREHFAAFKRAVSLGSFVGFLGDEGSGVKVISSEIRKSDPTIIDLVYKVTSKLDSVNVRVIAFEDGERSFAKAVVPMTFVDGTDANVGDGIAANVEHKISWQVSSDWAVDLAKVKVEVLTMENGLLPLELMRLPALDGHVACEFSWNAISHTSAFDALLWLYADQDSDISVCEGAVSRVSDGAVIARGAEVYQTTANFRTYQQVDGRSVSITEMRGSAIAFILGKMGYSLLWGDDLAHVNSVTRLDLQPIDANTVQTTSSASKFVAVRIYAYKQVD